MDESANGSRVEQLPLTVDWPTCDVGDGQGCQGVQVGEGTRCWAHLSDESLQEALASLSPGGRLDARGTVLSGALVRRMLVQMRDGAEGDRARVESANFTGARFLDKVWFDNVLFEGSTRFANATFENDASFFGTKLDHYASFHEATFRGLADFEKASFGQAAFKRIEFGPVIFNRATFGRLVEFTSVHFKYSAEFLGIVARGRASFVDCHFDSICVFQRAEFHGDADIAGSTFGYNPILLTPAFVSAQTSSITNMPMTQFSQA